MAGKNKSNNFKNNDTFRSCSIFMPEEFSEGE